MTESSSGTGGATTPSEDGNGHGTPSKQHGDPLLAATQGRDEGEGSRQGPSPEPPTSD